MKSIKIKLLQEGMVTATEVKDRMGRTLLSEGQTITAQNLKTLKAWGVTDVNIEDSIKERGASPKLGSVKAPPAIINEQKTLFKYADPRHPAVAEFFNICLARKVQGNLEN